MLLETEPTTLPLTAQPVAPRLIKPDKFRGVVHGCAHPTEAATNSATVIKTTFFMRRHSLFVFAIRGGCLSAA